MANTEAARELFIEELGRIVGGNFPAPDGGDGSTSGLGTAPPQRKDEPKFTSLAIGEEGGGPPTLTTLATHEEGGDDKIHLQPL